MGAKKVIENTIKQLEHYIATTELAGFTTTDPKASRYWFRQRNTYRHALNILQNEIRKESKQ